MPNYVTRWETIPLSRAQIRLLACVVATCFGEPASYVVARIPRVARCSARILAASGLLVIDGPGDSLARPTLDALRCVRDLAPGFRVCAEAMGRLENGLDVPTLETETLQ